MELKISITLFKIYYLSQISVIKITNFICRTQTISDENVAPDYTYDNITVPILMKASPITGKIVWAKNFLLSTEPNSEN